MPRFFRCPHIFLFTCLFVWVSPLAGSIFGQVFLGEKGPAFLTPPRDDPNFSLMGEFVGRVKNESNRNELWGLQIRAVGNDEFDAVAYRGGLPGQPKHRPDPVRMIGRRSGQLVVMSGGPWAVIVEPKLCRLIDFEGNSVGQLKRVRRRSSTMFAAPPEGGTVLFDGSDTQQFSHGNMTDEGLLTEGAQLNPMFQDFDLHVEFRLPYMPEADGQQRGNSGLYLQGRYECQVLDSFAQIPKIDGLGALYRIKPADLNMCFPPLVWQTYDVQFTAPRWGADGVKLRDARITSWINGIKVQDDVALSSKTGAGKPEGAFLSPIKIQDHGDPVRFRNIWIVDRGLTKSEFPQKPTKAEIQAAIRLQQKKKKQRAAKARKQRARLLKEKAREAAGEGDPAVSDNEVEVDKPVDDAQAGEDTSPKSPSGSDAETEGSLP